MFYHKKYIEYFISTSESSFLMKLYGLCKQSLLIKHSKFFLDLQ